MDERYAFGPQFEAVTFRAGGECVTFSPPGAGAVRFVSQPLAVVESGGLEEYSFFIGERFNFGEFPSGPAGADGQDGDDGTGIPEVFIDGQPATINFASTEIEGQTVYQMQVTPS